MECYNYDNGDSAGFELQKTASTITKTSNQNEDDSKKRSLKWRKYTAIDKINEKDSIPCPDVYLQDSYRNLLGGKRNQVNEEPTSSLQSMWNYMKKNMKVQKQSNGSIGRSNQHQQDQAINVN